jgi:tRNA-dihydrouridine synthase
VDAVSAARGALGNPWFFQQVRDVAAGREPRRPDFAEQKAVLREHYRLAVQLHGPRRAGKHMRKFGIKYARMHTRPKAVRMAFVAVETPADWQGVLDEYYTPAYQSLGHLAPFIPPVEGEH